MNMQQKVIWNEIHEGYRYEIAVKTSFLGELGEERIRVMRNAEDVAEGGEERKNERTQR